MDALARFLGRGTPVPGGLPVANPRLENPPSLQVLIDGQLDLDADALTLALREYDSELATASAELFPSTRQPEPGEEEPPPALMGLFGWGRHVVKLIGFNTSMPAEVLEPCVQAAHYEAEIKQLAFSHASHVLLYYAGYEPDPVEQMVALAAIAGCLARFGGVAVLNETGRTSVPAVVLLPHEEDETPMMTALRSLPFPFLFMGFVKLEIEDEPGVWMRTYGGHVLGLPDLALRTEGHQHGTFAFHAFANMLAYLRESGKAFLPGDTMQVGERSYLRLRERNEAEWYLESDGHMLVGDPITADEANVQRGEP